MSETTEEERDSILKDAEAMFAENSFIERLLRDYDRSKAEIERLQAALREVNDRIEKAANVLREQPGYTVKIIAEALAVLSPEPEGTVEERPRDNSITDAW